MDYVRYRGYVVTPLGDNRVPKEGGTPMGSRFLNEITSSIWELSEPIRSGRLTSPKRGSAYKR